MQSYLGALVEASPAECRIESSPMVINSPLNGGAGFAGKSGRKTANVCDANPIETSTKTVARFMSAALSKIKRHGKQNFLRDHGNYPKNDNPNKRRLNPNASGFVRPSFVIRHSPRAP
jgi:hypothetical protein